MKYLLSNSLVIVALGFVSTPVLRAQLNLSDFRACVSAAGGSYGPTCPLAAGAFFVDLPSIVIGRSVTISGASPYYRYASILVRGLTLQASPAPILQLAPGVSNVTIQNLTISGQRGNAISPPTGLYAQQWIDVDLSGYQGSGTSSVFLSGVDFDHAFGYAITAALLNTSVINCNITDAYAAGLFAAGNDGVQIVSTNIENSGGAGASLDASNHSQVLLSYFFANHGLCPDGNAGGQLVIQNGASFVSVEDSQFIGNYVGQSWASPGAVCWSTGIEGYGNWNTILGNFFAQHNAQGLEYTGGQNIIIGPDQYGFGNQIYDNQADGIGMYNYPGFPVSQNIYINGNTITRNGGDPVTHGYGIDITGQGNGNVQGTVSVQGNYLCSNATGPYYVPPQTQLANNNTCGVPGTIGN